ncbi:MAG: SPASM domain-containing protein, partial [Syntrophomonadaceae bacterium]|nr:SPASM domain-containing protein [Syntrophomonadaceae bacterium]
GWWDNVREIGSLREVVIGGIGEPLVAPLIEDALEQLSDYYLTVTTNGTVMNERLADLMVKSVDAVTVSVDGLEESVKEIRGTELSRILDNVGELNKRRRGNRPILNFQFVLSADNLHDIMRLIDLAECAQVNQVIVSNLVPQTEDNKDKIKYTRYENREVKSLFRSLRNYALRKGVGLRLPQCELKGERRCDFVDRGAAYICSTGEVVPCYRFSHPGQEFIFGRGKRVNQHSFGSILEEALIDIWNSERYTNYRDLIYNNHYPSCIDCELADGCDLARDTELDCLGISPSCGDCLWSRGFIVCP